MNKQVVWKNVCIYGVSAIVLFAISHFGLEQITNDSIRIFLITLVSAFSTAFLATAIWEFTAKYNFALQIRKLIGISTNIEQSGIETVFDDFNRIQWEEELKKTKSLEMVIVYGRTFRTLNRSILKLFVKKGRKIAVYVPNPDNVEIMKEFDRRFSYHGGETKKNIYECIDEFLKIGATVYVFDDSLQASYYRISDACYMSFFNHKTETGAVPSLKTSKGGEFFNYISGELDSIKSKSRLVVDCNPNGEAHLLRLKEEEKQC